MRTFFYKGRFIFMPIAAAAFLSLVSFVVMNLWNALLPELLHVAVITFWQAMGIFVLCKILFGFGRGGRGFGGGGGAPWMRRKMEERFKNMSPEEREKFKTKMEQRCENWGRHRGRRFESGWDNFKQETTGSTAKE